MFISALRRLIVSPWLLPDNAWAYLLAKFTFRARLGNDSLGWLQATLYSCRIDEYQRYSSVAQQIKALDKHPMSILDVGGGQGTIQEFLSPLRYHLCIIDINARALLKAAHAQLDIVAGDGCCLPFRDNAFDVVVSVDSLEHIPDTNKEDFCRELKRVSRNYVILHCPADSNDNSFQGTVYDTKFLEWYRRRFRKNEPNTMEHLESGLPQIEELSILFPGCIIIGKQNSKTWLKYRVLQYTPYVRLTTGLIYKTFLQRRDHLPPYHACLLVWRKMLPTLKSPSSYSTGIS